MSFALTGAISSTIFQQLLQVASRHAQSWCWSEKNGCACRDHQRPYQHCSVHAHRAEQWQRNRSLMSEIPDGEIRESQPERSSRSGEYHTFG